MQQGATTSGDEIGVQCVGELCECRRSGWAIWSLIDPTGQPDRCVLVGEEVIAVDVDARRSTEPVLVSRLGSVNDDSSDLDLWIVLRQCSEALVGNAPARAAIEVQQRDVHTRETSRGTQSRVTTLTCRAYPSVPSTTFYRDVSWTGVTNPGGLTAMTEQRT